MSFKSEHLNFDRPLPLLNLQIVKCSLINEWLDLYPSLVSHLLIKSMRLSDTKK